MASEPAHNHQDRNNHHGIFAAVLVGDDEAENVPPIGPHQKAIANTAAFARSCVLIALGKKMKGGNISAVSVGVKIVTISTRVAG